MDLDLFKGSHPEGPGSPDGYERNYFFIYDHKHPHIDLSGYKNAQAETYHGKLFLTVTALQDIFIGSGKIEKSAGRLYDMFSYIKTGPGQKTLNIPGSSLKGCVLTGLSMFLEPRSIDFFSAGKGMAKVYFSDFPMPAKDNVFPKEIPARFSPRAVPGNVLLKLYKKEYKKDLRSYGPQTSAQGVEKILAVKTGSRFQGVVHFKKVDVFEIALLVLAFGNMPGNRFNFKIGGAKNRAMGLIRMEIDYVKSFYSHTLKDISLDKVIPFEKLKPDLEKTVLLIKQDYPKLDPLIKKIREEYGQ